MTWIKCTDELPKIKSYESDICIVKDKDNKYALANYGTFKQFGTGESHTGWFPIHSVYDSKGSMINAKNFTDIIVEWKYVEDHT